MSSDDTDEDNVGVDLGGGVEQIRTPKRPRAARRAPPASPFSDPRIVALFDEDTGAGTGTCTHCGRDGFRVNRNSMFNHLGRCLSKGFTSPAVQPTQLPRTAKQEFEEAALGAIALCNLPFSIVEAAPMRRWLHAASRLGPHLPTLSRGTMRTLACQKSDKCLDDLIELLNRPGVFHTLSSDAWTAKNSRSGYVAVMVHTQDESWRLHTRLLAFAELNSSHTANAYVAEWRKASDRLVRTPVAVVCDSAPTMTSAQKKYFEAVEEPAGIKLPCGLHVLQLSVKHALKPGVCKEAGGLKKRCRTIAAQFCMSVTLTDQLRKTIESFNGRQVRVIQEVECRWSSAFRMMNRLYELRQALRIMKEEKHCDFLNDSECRSLWWVCRVLEPFSVITDNLQRDSARFADYWFGVADVLTIVDEMLLDHPDAAVAKELRDALVKDVCSRMYGTNETPPGSRGCRKTCFNAAQQADALLLAYLHPRYFMRLTPEEREAARTRVADLVCALVPEFAGEEARGVVPTLLKVWENTITKAITESRGTLGLEWWSTDGLVFQPIRIVARALLSVPASTAGVERLFSAAGLIMSSRRNRLAGDSLSALLRIRYRELNVEPVICPPRESCSRRGSMARPDAQPELERPVEAENPSVRGNSPPIRVHRDLE